VLILKAYSKNIFGININEEARNQWLSDRITSLPAGLRILDAGAGELRNKPLCAHLVYVSQDICQYEGRGDSLGLQTGSWDTSNIDLVCDITNIPEPDSSYDVILCSEVFEHLPDPLKALSEFKRLLKSDGILIVTAPFASFVHFAPYHFASGFSKYWYEHHIPDYGFEIQELTSNGDWFGYMKQEMIRLPSMARKYGSWHWPLSYLFAGLGFIYFSMPCVAKKSDDVACFGWHCIAKKL
jgi:SAM-dependent methyltransferase